MAIALLGVISIAFLAQVFFEYTGTEHDNEDLDGDHVDSDYDEQNVVSISSEHEVPDVFTDSILEIDASIDEASFIESQNLPINQYQEGTDIGSEHSIPSEILEKIENNSTYEFVHEVSFYPNEESSPLDDWVTNPDIMVINVEPSDCIFLDVENSVEGTFFLLEANYFEGTTEEGNSDRFKVHRGANLYFIEEGGEFPSDYVWSEESAGLFDEKKLSANEADFNSVSFVARLVGDVNDNADEADANLRVPLSFHDLEIRIFSNRVIDTV